MAEIDEVTVVATVEEKPAVNPAREALAKLWLERVQAAKSHFEEDFKRMRDCMKLARDGTLNKIPDFYTANIIQRFINQKVAVLYAKNPRVVAKRRPRMEYRIWDGRSDSLQTAMQQIMMAQQVGLDPVIVAPQAVELVADIEQARARQRMIDRVGRTLEILFDYFMNEGSPDFKTRAKQLVRRTEVCGVGYVRLNFQRILGKDPSIQERLNDATERLAHLERLMSEAQEGDITPDSAEMEELRLMIADLQSQVDIVVREGLVFDFPRSTAIIPDPDCRQLRGFVGARWIATEMLMTPDKVKELYGVDLQKQFTAYTRDGLAHKDAPHEPKGDAKKEEYCLIYEIQDKESGLIYTVCEGYRDFLEEPKAPDVWLERFFNVYALTFNDIEDEERLFPLSDVELIRPMQEEYNRSRQGIREHRMRNRPGWVVAKGALEEEDKNRLTSDVTNAVVELAALQPGQDIKTIVQPKPTAPIDPNLYDVNQAFVDIQRVAGMMEAHLGELSGATATESSIGEQARVTASSSNVDDLDSFLSDLARGAGQILLSEMSAESVQKIVGPGAVWPQQSRQELADEIFLDIQAGSSGRPNKAQELANIERAAPYIVQTPEINPRWWGRKMLETLFDDVEIEEAIADGLPSITALNAMAARSAMTGGAPATGSPETDPGSQGDRGVMNAPNPQARQPGPQPAYPALTDV